MAYSDTPKPLGKLIDEFVESYPHKKEMKRCMILSRFPDVVGKTMAGKVKELYFKGDTLFAHVPEPGWRHEMHMQRYTIRKKLNEAVKEAIIKEIRVLA